DHQRRIGSEMWRADCYLSAARLRYPRDLGVVCRHHYPVDRCYPPCHVDGPCQQRLAPKWRQVLLGNRLTAAPGRDHRNSRHVFTPTALLPRLSPISRQCGHCRAVLGPLTRVDPCLVTDRVDTNMAVASLNRFDQVSEVEELAFRYEVQHPRL